MSDSELHSAISKAIKNRDDSKLTRLLSELSSPSVINQTDNTGQTLLHHTLEVGLVYIAQTLMEAGADVNVADRRGRTPLHHAVRIGHYGVVRALVEAGANVQAVNEGKTAVEMMIDPSALTDSTETIREMFTLLTDAGATVDGATAKISPLVPSDVIRAIVPEDTPFWLAANNDAPMLAVELAAGLDPNMKTENGMTLLHWACAGDAPECVQLLLDAGADKEAGDPTPIFYCMHESSDCLKHMLNYSTDVNVINSCEYPIYHALAANSPACVTALVGAGAWVDKEEMEARIFETPLESALNKYPVPVDALQALLAAAGERVLSEKIGGMPPLHYAVQYSNVYGVRALVEAGADLNESYNYHNVLMYLRLRLANTHLPYEVPYLTATLDYLKSLPCFSKYW